MRAVAEMKLEELRRWLSLQPDSARDQNQRAYFIYALNQIKRFQEDPKKMNLTKPNEPPDGQPIGTDWWAMAERDWCDWR